MSAANAFEEIVQYARIYSDPPERAREGCRAIIVKDNKVLLSWEERKDVYMSPGGGIEPGETLEECVIRELAEETGFVVKPVRPFVKVNEYCYDTLWVSYYFICEIEGSCERRLTESEIYNKVKPSWVELDKAIEFFSSYESKTVDHASLFLREFTVLNRLKDAAAD